MECTMSHWKSAIPIMLAATLGLVAAWTPLSLGTGRLHADPIPAADFSLSLSEPLLTPAMIQERGVATLSGMSYLLASGALIATFTALVLLAVARASKRREEVLVHRAVGASRKQLLRSGVNEGMLMAFIALVIGSALGLVTLQSAQAHWSGTITAGRSLLPFGIAAAIGTAIVLGVLLPLRSLGKMRPHLPPLTPLLAPAICALQVAVCFAVLVQSRQVLREAVALTRTQDGGENRQLVELEIPGAPADRAYQLADLLKATGASLSSPGTLQGVGTANMAIAECGNCSQGTIWTPLRPVAIALNAVSADTFRALHAHLIEGRWIADTDTWQAQRVAVISRGLARAHFENGRPLGRAIQLGQGKNNRFTVVGVVSDPLPQSLGAALQPAYTVYTSVLQVAPTAVELLLRSSPTVIPAALIRGVLGETEWRARIAAPVRWFGAALWSDAALVAAIALVGITAAIAMWVNGMVAELAVRRAVGARRRDVLVHIVGRWTTMIVAGLVLGAMLALLSADPLSAIVPGVQTIDFKTFLEVAALVIGATAVPITIAAWRACRLTAVELLVQHDL
jgi:putative ABC transport system permease protein